MDLLTPSLPLIRALQLYGWLAGPMKILSVLGSEPFFLLLLPLIYWNINRQLGARLGVLLLFSVALNDVIKIAFALPRPFWTPGVAQLAPSPETTFGFPSGHAQSTAALWTFLALQSRRRIWMFWAFVLLVLVSLSRLFLGAHYPLDVVGGAGFGYALLWIFMRLEKPVAAWLKARGLAAQIGAALAVCAVLGLLYAAAVARLVPLPLGSPGYQTWVLSAAGLSFAARVGALFGLLCGLALARRHALFENEASLGLKNLRFVVGIIVLAALRFGVGHLLPASLLASFGVYCALTLWVTLGAPWLFLHWGWMRAARGLAVGR